MSSLTRRAILGAAPALASCTMRDADRGDDVITLRIADGFPASHYIVELITRPFMAEAERASGGRLKFEYFPSEQLGKLRDMLRLTRHGVMDIGYVVPSFNSDKMPLSSIMELPNAMGGDLVQGVRIFGRLTEPGGFLYTHEFEPNGLRPLTVFASPSNQLAFSTSRNLTGLADLRGLKIRTAGSALDALVRELGAVSVRMATAELYESLSRGTIDGLFQSHVSALAYHMPDLLRRMTLGVDFGTIAATYSIGERRFQSLPAELQTVLTDVGRRISQEASAEIEARERKAEQTMREADVALLEFNAADQERLTVVFEKVRRDWASAMERIGRPGQAALAALEAAQAAEGAG